MLDLTEMLAATQRCLDSAELERNAAYGFTLAVAEPSRVADVQAREERSAAPSAPSRPSTRPH